jgi:hypothetical protein
MIDTSLMPQITVRIQFTTKGVLGISNGTVFSNFATSTSLPKEAFHFKTMEHYAIVEIVSAGAAYDAMQERIMATVGYIPVPFKRVHCFQGGMNEGDVRFNIATRSLDRVYFCTDGGEASAGAPYLSNKIAIAGTLLDACERGLDHEIYDSARFRSIAANMEGTACMSIAGARVPAFDASVLDWFSMTRNALPKPDENDVKDVDLRMDIATWKDGRFLACQRFCAPQSDLKNASGLDTRAVNVDGLLKTQTLVPTGHNLLVFAESTAELRIMPGREIQLIP